MWFKNFTKWIASFFSSKGDGSSKRATVFAVCMLYLYINILFAYKVTKEDWRFYQLVLNALVILLILGVATIQSVIEFIRIIKGSNKKEDNKNESLR